MTPCCPEPDCKRPLVPYDHTNHLHREFPWSGRTPVTKAQKDNDPQYVCLCCMTAYPYLLPGEINLQVQGEGITATWLLANGRPDPEVRRLFGTCTLPTPFKASYGLANAKARIQALNPGKVVTTRTPQEIGRDIRENCEAFNEGLLLESEWMERQTQLWREADNGLPLIVGEGSVQNRRVQAVHRWLDLHR